MAGQTNKNTKQLCITIPKILGEVADKFLATPGIGTVPKGTYSPLIASLLQSYLEKELGADIEEIFSFVEGEVSWEMSDLKEHLATIAGL